MSAKTLNGIDFPSGCHNKNLFIGGCMAKKIFVGNLPFKVTEEEIRSLFEQHGEVLSVALMSDRETGRPRGFGFVEMENAEEAVAALNGTEIEGRALKVDIARERPPRSGGGGGGYRNGGGGGGGGRRFGGGGDRQRNSW
jgi:cold-inducible RNA-binding protein